MATKRLPGRGPAAMTEGYSMSGSQANSVALKPAGTLSGGKRFSVRGPVRGGSSPRRAATQLARKRRQSGMDFMGLHGNEAGHRRAYPIQCSKSRQFSRPSETGG